MSLSGTTLRFDRSGRRLIAIEADEIAVVDTAAALTVRLPYRARAVACFDEELWIATHDHQLVRVDPTGAMLGPPVALPFAAHAVLAPAPCGPPAAVWWADAPVVCSIDRPGARPAAGPAARTRCLTRRPLRDPFSPADAGPLVCAEVDADAAIPITGRRLVIARGSCVTLPSGLTLALAPSTRVLGGCVSSDGKSLTLLVAHGRARELVAIALGLGQVIARRPIAAGAAVAIAEGVAAIQDQPRALQVIDLATNRVLGGVAFGHDVTAFAVDPSGRSLAVRSATGEVELHRIDPLLPRPCPAEPAAPVSPRVLIAGRAPELRDAPDALDLRDAPDALDLRDAPDALDLPDAPDAPAAAEIEPPAAHEHELDPQRFDRIAIHASLHATTALTAPIAPAALRDEPARPASEHVGVHRFSAPTAHATDWLCGSSDYLHGGG